MRLCAALLLAAPAALAHQTSASFSELDVRGNEVHALLRFSLTDLRTQTALDPKQIPAAAPALAHLVLEAFTLKGCALQPGTTAELEGDDGVALRALWRCDAPPEELQVKVGYIDSFPIGHTHLSRITWAGKDLAQRVAQADDPAFDVRHLRSPAQEFWRFLLLGIEHIFTGYDHIAFLLALLLLGGTLPRLAGVVTAFTVAHSITLALAALDLLAPSPRLIEPLIAASIVFVAGENIYALRTQHAEAALRHRWMITFAFGLIHGFGFAAVLRELDLPRRTLAAGLVSFNLGVEAGQLCIVALMLPLLRLLKLSPRGVRNLSLVIAALGTFWLVQRLLP